MFALEGSFKIKLGKPLPSADRLKYELLFETFGIKINEPSNRNAIDFEIFTVAPA